MSRSTRSTRSTDMNVNYCTICDGEITGDQQEYVHSDPYGDIGDCHEACCPCTHDPELGGIVTGL